MGGIAMMASVILLSPKRAPEGVEARRTPPRVRSLMEIVGSNEQMACMGFALTPLRVMDAYSGPMERTLLVRM
jgi:hypothetical protein